MRVETSERGFRTVRHEAYTDGNSLRLVQESSAIGDYSDAMENPGSSYLWFGNDHHLNREEVYRLILILSHWLREKRLPEKV